MTFVLGLTGSVGMGKSTTAGLFRVQGVPVDDADAVVHELYRTEAVPLVEAAFPGTVRAGAIDRALLRERVLGDAEAMQRLEAIVHPLVKARRSAFLAAHRSAPLAVLDIPLLFETGGEAECDAVLVVSAPFEVQRARVLARPGMTEEAFRLIHVKQMPDEQKRRRAHFIVDTSRDRDSAARQVQAIIRALAGRPGRRASLLAG